MTKQLTKEERMIMADLERGIKVTDEECRKAEGDLFWSRYWAGYHTAYTNLARKIENLEHRTQTGGE